MQIIRHSRLLLIGLLVPFAAHAATIFVANPSFENPVTPPDSFIVSAPPDDWSSYGTIDAGWRSVGVVNPATTTLYADPVPHGNNIGVVFLGPTFANSEAGLRQTLAATLQTFTRYTLTVEVGNMANSAEPNNEYSFTGFPGYRVDLLAGGVVVASDNNTLLPGEGRFLTSTVELSIGASHALAGQQLGIRLVNLDSAAGIEVNFDDVRLDATAIPEPSSAGLLAGVAVVMLATTARRRPNRSA